MRAETIHGPVNAEVVNPRSWASHEEAARATVRWATAFSEPQQWGGAAGIRFCVGLMQPSAV